MAEDSRALIAERAQLPGGFVIAETGEKIYLIDKKEGNLYDTLIVGEHNGVAPVGFNITQGAEFEFFINVSQKSKAFTSFKVDKKVPSGWYIAVTKLGLHFRAYLGNIKAELSDILKIGENSVVNFTKIETVKKEEPPMFWQSGFGWYGQTTATNQSLVTSGVPSPAAIPNIKVPFSLVPGNDVEGMIRFPRNVLNTEAGVAYPWPTLSGPVACMMILHGLIMKSGVKQ